VVILLAAMSAQADAVTLFSNFNSDPTNLYETGGWTVSGPGSEIGGPYSPAMAFTPSGTGAYVLTQIDVAIGFIVTTSFDLTLYSDSGGAPGSVITSWTDISSTEPLDSCCGLETVTPGTTITLNAGTQYWLLASANADDPDAWAAWDENNLHQTGPMWSSQFGVSSGTEGAFDVLGDPAVPEPSSASLIVCALALLGLAVRRRQRA
jgi:hypothetical protein